MLLAPITDSDIEIKPDGLLYLPEIKYRRILHKAFGPGGWGLIPKGEILHFQVIMIILYEESWREYYEGGVCNSEVGSAIMRWGLQ